MWTETGALIRGYIPVGRLGSWSSHASGLKAMTFPSAPAHDDPVFEPASPHRRPDRKLVCDSEQGRYAAFMQRQAVRKQNQCPIARRQRRGTANDYGFTAGKCKDGHRMALQNKRSALRDVFGFSERISKTTEAAIHPKLWIEKTSGYFRQELFSRRDSEPHRVGRRPRDSGLKK
jgi:hypothetical protein